MVKATLCRFSVPSSSVTKTKPGSVTICQMYIYCVTGHWTVTEPVLVLVKCIFKPTNRHTCCLHIQSFSSSNYKSLNFFCCSSSGELHSRPLCILSRPSLFSRGSRGVTDSLFDSTNSRASNPYRDTANISTMYDCP